MTFSVRMTGSGLALPQQAVPTEHFDQKLGLPPGSLSRATGVAQRYVCDGEDQLDLAAAAIKAAAAQAGIALSQIDLFVAACGVGYQTIPSTAPAVMGRLGIADGQAAAFDVNSTCLSFLTGLETAAMRIAARQNTCAVVVSSEIASRALPWETDPETAALFGDGAAAVIVEPNTEGGPVASHMVTYPSAYDACSIKAGGTRLDVRSNPDAFVRQAVFDMDGRALFRITTRYFKSFVDDLLAKASWTRADVDLVIPHQASPFALQHMAKVAGFPADKIIDISRDYGNQIAASIPFAYATAIAQRRVSPGAKLLFLGTSAGVSLGGLAWQA